MSDLSKRAVSGTAVSYTHLDVYKRQVLELEKSYDKMFCYVFTPILERYEVPEKDRTYIMAFYIRGLMAIITEWLKTDCKDSIEYIITVIQKCVMRHQEEK